MRDLDVERTPQTPSIEIATDADADDKENDDGDRVRRISVAKSTPASPNTFRDAAKPLATSGRPLSPGRLSPALFAKLTNDSGEFAHKLLGKCSSEPDMLGRKPTPNMSRSCHNGILLCLQVQDSAAERDKRQQRPGWRPDPHEAPSKSSGSEEEVETDTMIPEGRGGSGGERERPVVGEGKEGSLIVPRKIPNPCVDSVDRQNLHRELLFNQRIGKNVLNQKSELQRALEKHKDAQARKDLELQKQEEKTPLERVIEERARRLESFEKGSLENESKSSLEKPEFLQVHARLRARMDSK